MKLEIKKDMYIRTKDGIIDKVVFDYNGHCNNPNCNYKHISCERNYYNENEIKEVSFEITDLIRAGDYINGQKVYYDEELDYLYVQSFDGDGEFYQESIKKQSFINNIETIVTHEQMEQMSYKIEENK